MDNLIYALSMNSFRVLVAYVGSIMYHENKVDDMCKIMEHHKYVPTVKRVRKETFGSGESIEIPVADMWLTLFGDQLTVAHARGATAIRHGHELPEEQLKGLIPVLEDWHTRMTLIKVIWTRLFKEKSSQDKGTLYDLIHRTAVPSDPQKNMQATKDLFQIVLNAHIIAAAQQIIGQNVTDTLASVARLIVNKYIRFDASSNENDDMIHNYACEVITLGMIWANYYDAIHEGNGHRIMQILKYLLVIF
uniref:DUF6589 domain-containing protein n=1 Tax=Amphimedon queenslandica TaxID=400682 RepID=A0A1X7V4W0_AMPQE